MSERTFGAVGVTDGLPISNDTEQARALGYEHAELLRPFQPTQAIFDDADALNAYISGFNEGIRVAASQVVAVHQENRELKQAKTPDTTVAATDTQADLEREETEQRLYGSGNMAMENFKRKRAGLPELSYPEYLSRAARLMRKREQEEPERQKRIDAMLGV